MAIHRHTVPLGTGRGHHRIPKYFCIFVEKGCVVLYKLDRMGFKYLISDNEEHPRS